MSTKGRPLALIIFGLLVTLSAFAETATSGDGIGRPIYTVQPPATSVGDLERPLITVPTWSSEFTSKLASGEPKRFPYTMVGTSPWAGSATTTVPTQIIPIALIFSNGAILDGGTRVASTIASPIFQPYASQTGFTQYGDAMERASFYRVVKSTSPDWHVILGQPGVLPTENLTVPPEDGIEFNGSISGAPIGLVDMEWFSQKLKHLLKTLNPDPHSLSIFLTYNSFLFSETPEHCCLIGFHSAVATPGPGIGQNVNTFIWATENDPRIFSVPLEDVTALSHEVAEWYHDPLISNVVPGWMHPGTSECFSNILEVGDPIQLFPNLSFRVLTNGSEYHLQDVALFSWFARQLPSIGLKGRYSYRGGKLPSPAPACEASR